jgi:hypothetical protein
MATDTNNPAGTGETIFDAQNAFASLLAVEDGEPEAGGAQPEEETDEVEASGSEEETEATQDAEEDSESEESDEAEEDEKPPSTFRVKVDGEEVEVTLDELQKGYSRTQDYTRKTQALAEQRKAAEAETEAVRQERAYYAQMLQVLQQQFQQTEAQPDWDALYQENPTEWVRQRELWRDKQERVRAVEAESQRMQGVRQQEEAQARQAKLAEETQRLVEAIPEWKDNKRAVEERNKLVETAKKVGFSDEELGQILDHRALVVLRKAALYDDLMSKKSQIKPNPASGPKLAKPGSATTKPSKKSEAQLAQERLAKTGSMRDAAAAFDQFI